EGLSDQDLAHVGFEQKLGAQVSLSRIFRDERGQTIKFGSCVAGKPVVLVLGYYGCPMLCPLTSNGMLEGMQDISWSIGKEFEVVQVSIDPHETSELASAKKSAYLKRYGRSGAASGWHFLTGSEPSLRALADEVGFRYAYDSSIKQYAHPSGLVVL